MKMFRLAAAKSQILSTFTPTFAGSRGRNRDSLSKTRFFSH
jgi:hypothetical protein